MLIPFFLDISIFSCRVGSGIIAGLAEKSYLMDKKINYDAIIKLPDSTISSRIAIKIEKERIELIDFVSFDVRLKAPRSPIAQDAVQQILRYFYDPDWQFNLPTVVRGTEFQQKVWQVLRSIKRGHTLTYGEVAKQLNSSARAVGNACRHNPLPLLVPCHRVIAKAGFGGFAGERIGPLLDLKKWLISHERIDCE